MTKEKRRGYLSKRPNALLAVVPIILLAVPGRANIVAEKTAVTGGFAAAIASAEPAVVDPGETLDELVASQYTFFDWKPTQQSIDATDVDSEILIITANKLNLPVSDNTYHVGVNVLSPSQVDPETDHHAILSVAPIEVDADTFTPQVFTTALAAPGEAASGGSWTGVVLGCILAAFGVLFYLGKTANSR